MKLLIAIATVTTITMVVLVSAAGIPTAVHYVGHEKVSATMAKGGQIINDNGLIVLANRRTAAEAEMHDKTNHVFIIVDGEATFMTGGKLVGAKEDRPGEHHGGVLEGGVAHHLTKGDVITVPAKTPHWWKEVKSPTIGYYAVNIAQ